MQYLQSRIVFEEPEPDNPFAARAAYCNGYDVYGEMLGRATWADMTYLLFRGEAPSPAQAAALDILAVALGNAGPRDPAVHAAMCAGVGGSVAAASLMAALAVGSGSLGGSREVVLAMEAWRDCKRDLDAWQRRWANPPREPVGVWLPAEHPVGFDPHGVSTATPVKQTLARLAALDEGSSCAWLLAQLVADGTSRRPSARDDRRGRGGAHRPRIRSCCRRDALLVAAFAGSGGPRPRAS